MASIDELSQEGLVAMRDLYQSLQPSFGIKITCRWTNSSYIYPKLYNTFKDVEGAIHGGSKTVRQIPQAISNNNICKIVLIQSLEL